MEKVVKKVLRLVDINEFKRKQAAPALRVSRKALVTVEDILLSRAGENNLLGTRD